MTREERIEYMRKRCSERRDEVNARAKKWRSEHREERNACMKKRYVEELNKNGVKKSNIRETSRRILHSCHSKLSGYEIHHCFGYEDPNRFIYIPRELHIKIHKFLRDNHIPADIDHFNSIRGLISSYHGYSYIHS